MSHEMFESQISQEMIFPIMVVDEIMPRNSYL